MTTTAIHQLKDKRHRVAIRCSFYLQIIAGKIMTGCKDNLIRTSFTPNIYA